MHLFNSLSLLVLLGTFLIVLGENSCPEFDCFNGGTCADSDADFSDHPTDSNGNPLDFHTELQRNGKHCACPEGWTGLRCKRAYNTCQTTGHKCYHGGECIDGLEDAWENTQHYCDCTNATDGKNKFVGKYCEHPQSNPCGDESESDSIFCVNGGTCKDNYKTANKPCACGDSYTGPHCEFKKDSVPVCDLDCKNGGTCELGIKSYTKAEDLYMKDFWDNHEKFMHCKCKDDTHHGLKCEIKSDQCGDYNCFNGGTCVKERIDGKSVAHCDCTTAHTDDKSYAGRHCQYESNGYCDKDQTENGQLFCANGGTCNPDGSHLDCICPDGFHGPVCEFADGEDNTDEYETCSLECQNGGECRKGFKDTSIIKDYAPELEEFDESNKNFEHCVCPAGFMGVECEHEVEICGKNEHACFFGGKCIKDGNDDACDCEAGFTSFDKLAGKYCQHKSTTICTPNGQPGMAKNNFAFCVNNGKCKGTVEGDDDGHPGCECGTQFEGPHCEFRAGSGEADQILKPRESETNNTGLEGAEILGVIAVVIFAVAVAAFVAMRLVRKSKTGIDMDHTSDMNGDGNIAPAAPKDSSTVVSDGQHSVGPVLDMGPSKDLDGNELENVEII